MKEEHFLNKYHPELLMQGVTRDGVIEILKEYKEIIFSQSKHKEDEEVIIYTESLGKEIKNHYKGLSVYPIRYNLIDVLKNMKFGRPKAAQDMIDGFIAFAELNQENCVPFSPEEIGLVWNKKEG